MTDAVVAAEVAAPYRQNLEHLRAELDRLLQQRAGAPARTVAQIRAAIRLSAAAAEAAGIRLRLPHLAATFNLTPFEYDVSVLALAPEIDGQFESPTVDSALRLFCCRDYDRLQARPAFHANANLLGHHLIQLDDRPRLADRRITLDPRIVDFLLEGDRLDGRLTSGVPTAYWITPSVQFAELLLPDDVCAALARVTSGMAGLLDGAAGSGRRSAVEAWCAARKYPLLVFDCAVASHGGDASVTLLKIALREAQLYGAALFLRGWDALLSVDPAMQRLRVLAEQAVAAFDGPLFIGATQTWVPAVLSSFVSIAIPPADEVTRQRMWTRELVRRGVADSIDAARLARAFKFTPGRIARTAEQAAREEPLTTAGVVRACRREAGEHLIAFARATPARRGWDDLILPRDTAAQLHELCDQARQRQRVFGDWGFGATVSRGKGLISLLTGPSGTGKTLSAEVIATELGLDLYRIDLAAVVSKYIGETEKNLSRIFDDAERSSAILFFDEADSIFGRRTEVRDAHDRYANAEVNFLLQRVDDYEGIVLLASNMSNNIDGAFLRRMHFVVEYPFPDEQHRARIWRRHFPRDAPVADDIDFEFLARRFRLTGGSIRNVVLAAAFRAASAGDVIRMPHVVLALKREYQRQGKVCDRADFERYYELVR